MAFDGLNKRNWTVADGGVEDGSNDRIVEVETRQYGEGYEPRGSFRVVEGAELDVDKDEGMKAIPGQEDDKD